MAEHRVYTASSGLFIALGAGIGIALRWFVRRRPRALPATLVILVSILAVLATLTVRRNRVWADPVTLWSDAAEGAPSTWAFHYALGDALRARGLCEEAIVAFDRAIRVHEENPHSTYVRGRDSAPIIILVGSDRQVIYVIAIQVAQRGHRIAEPVSIIQRSGKTACYITDLLV